MSARQSASGKPANFLTKADEFFAFWLPAGQRMQRAGRPALSLSKGHALPALLYSHLPGAPVALLQSRILLASNSILSLQERS